MPDDERSLRDDLMAAFEELSTQNGYDSSSDAPLPLYTKPDPAPAPKAEGEVEGDKPADGEKPAEGRARDDKGRFAPKADGADDKAAAPADQNNAAKPDEQSPDSQQQAPAQAPVASEPPVTWQGEALRQEWAKLPQTVRDHIATTEQRYTETLRQVNQTLMPVHQLAQVRGLSWHEGLKQLTDAQAMLDRDPKAALLHIAKVYKVDLDELADIAGGYGQQQQQPAPQPAQLQPVLSRLEALEQRLQQEAEQQRSSELTARMQMIDRFARDPANPHFSTVEKDLPAFFPIAQARNPGASPEVLLKAAYDLAVRNHPTLGPQVEAQLRAAQEEARRKAEREAAEKARQKASANHRGAPGRPAISSQNAAPKSDGSIRADIERAWAEVELANS